MAALSEPQPWETLVETTLEGQCCDVKWHDGATILAATYDYVEEERVRKGGLVALRVGANGALAASATLELRGGYAVAVAPTTGAVAVATADGRVAVAAVGGRGDGDAAPAVALVAASEPKDHLFTSIEWASGTDLVVAEGDGGRVSLWTLGGGGAPAEVAGWAAHSYAPGCPAEVWCATRLPSDGLVLSGADDGLLKG